MVGGSVQWLQMFCVRKHFRQGWTKTGIFCSEQSSWQDMFTEKSCCVEADKKINLKPYDSGPQPVDTGTLRSIVHWTEPELWRIGVAGERYGRSPAYPPASHRHQRLDFLRGTTSAPPQLTDGLRSTSPPRNTWILDCTELCMCTGQRSSSTDLSTQSNRPSVLLGCQHASLDE